MELTLYLIIEIIKLNKVYHLIIFINNRSFTKVPEETWINGKNDTSFIIYFILFLII